MNNKIKTIPMEVIEYIYLKKHGDYEDLLENFGKDIVSLLSDTVLIEKLKVSPSVNKWKISKESKIFIETILPRKNFSIMEKIQNKINDLLLK